MYTNYPLINRNYANEISNFYNSNEYSLSHCLDIINELIKEKCNKGEYEVTILRSHLNLEKEKLELLEDDIIKTIKDYGYDVTKDYNVLYDDYITINWSN